MKKTFLIIIIILELLIIKIPSYIELNDLAIIEEVTIKQENTRYTIILKEIIPIKDDQGINYEYKYYQETASSISKAYNKLAKQTKKKLYLKKVKSLITNISSSSEIITELNINPTTITHTNNIKVN